MFDPLRGQTSRNLFGGCGRRVTRSAAIRSVRISGMKNSTATLAKRNELRKHWRQTIDPDSFPHEIERVCRDCKQLKMCRWSSSFTQTGSPEYKTRCDDCHNKYLNDLRKA